jgi:hypothetical protein
MNPKHARSQGVMEIRRRSGLPGRGVAVGGHAPKAWTRAERSTPPLGTTRRTPGPFPPPARERPGHACAGGASPSRRTIAHGRATDPVTADRPRECDDAGHPGVRVRRRNTGGRSSVPPQTEAAHSPAWPKAEAGRARAQPKAEAERSLLHRQERRRGAPLKRHFSERERRPRRATGPRRLRDRSEAAEGERPAGALPEHSRQRPPRRSAAGPRAKRSAPPKRRPPEAKPANGTQRDRLVKTAHTKPRPPGPPGQLATPQRECYLSYRLRSSRTGLCKEGDR